MVDEMQCELKKNWSKESCKKSVGEGEFKLILPLFDNSNNKIKKKEYNNYLNAIEQRFGGSSSWRIGGCYVDEKKKTQCEGNVIITSVRDFDSPYDKKLKKLNYMQRKKKLADDYKFIVGLSKKARRSFGQESALAIFDNIKDASLVIGAKRKNISKKRITKDFEPFKEVF